MAHMFGPVLSALCVLPFLAIELLVGFIQACLLYTSRGGGHGGGEEEREQVRTEKGVFIRIPPNMPEQRGIVLDFHGGRG